MVPMLEDNNSVNFRNLTVSALTLTQEWNHKPFGTMPAIIIIPESSWPNMWQWMVMGPVNLLVIKRTCNCELLYLFQKHAFQSSNYNNLYFSISGSYQHRKFWSKPMAAIFQIKVSVRKETSDKTDWVCIECVYWVCFVYDADNFKLSFLKSVTVAFWRRKPRMQGSGRFGSTNNKSFPARPGSLFIDR